jgi:glycine betaine catabolism B
MKPWINCEISKIKQETPDTKTFTLVLEEAMPFIPSQFVMVMFREGELKDKLKAARAYSISSSSLDSKNIDLTIRLYDKGTFTPEIFKSSIGTKLKVRGPYGKFIYSGEEDIVMLAAGSGIAPFIGIVKEVVDKKLDTKMQLIYADKTEGDLIGKDFFDKLSKNKKLELTYSLTRQEWEGETGRINEKLIKNHINYVEDRTFFICGPPKMVNNAIIVLQQMGVKPINIKTEKYD